MEREGERRGEKKRNRELGLYLNNPEQNSQDSYTLHPLVQIGAGCRRVGDGSPHPQDYPRSVAVVVVDCSRNTVGGHLRQRIISQIRWIRTVS